MSTILFARHNYAKAPQYRLLTTIERNGEEIRVYKRAVLPAAQPHLDQLLTNQQVVSAFVGDRAVVIEGQHEEDGRISYPFMPLPSLQKLISEQVLRDNYAAAYRLLQEWVRWIQSLPTEQCDPRDGAMLAAIYGDSLPDGAVPCLQVGLLDLTTENVLWDAKTSRYVLIDHDIVLPDPVPLELVTFRLLFFLCHNLRHIFQSAAERHPLRQFGYKGFLVPAEWDVTGWFPVDELDRLLRGEARLQSHYAAAPVSIDVGEGIAPVAERQVPNVAAQLAQRDAAIVLGFAKYDQDTQQYQQWIAERDTHIDDLRSQVAHKNQDIVTLQQWVAERDAQLRKGSEDIATLQRWLTERDELVAQREVEIVEQARKSAEDAATFQRWLTERDELIALREQEIIERNQELVEARAHREHAERDVATLHGWVADRDGQILQLHEVAAAANARATQTEAALSQIQSSLGWKLLLPFWTLRQRILPSDGRVIRNARRARTVVRIVRREGPRGLARHTAGWVRHRAGLAPSVPVPTGVAIQMPVLAGDNNTSSDVYAQWIEANEPDAKVLQQQRIDAHLRPDQPLISVLTPVYNPPLDVLQAMIDSVLAQTYSNWELLLVHGSLENAAVSALLDKAAARDKRIRVQHLPMNRGIVGNTNAGLAMVGGAFVAFLDHDDTLAPFALFEVVRLLNDQPDSDLIYSDSDLLSFDGSRRFDPLFKPDWSPAIMLSANYATHLCVVRASILHDLGGLSEGTDGAQDWDLILRVSERTSRIAHLPKVLYHWRESPGSTAVDISRKPYALHAQFKVIKDHLQRRGLDAEVRLDHTGYIRVDWPLVQKTLVSIIIPSRNLELLQRCIDSINAHTSYRQYEIIVIDTTKDGAIASYYSDDSHGPVQVIRYTAPFNYSAVNNLAAARAAGDALLFLNDDTEAIDDAWLSELVRWVEIESVGVVGAKLLREDGRIQHAGVVVGLGGFADHPFANGPEGQHTIYGCTEWYRNYTAVTGACLMIRRTLFAEIGGFDGQLALCGNDVELCLRVRQLGLQVLYTPFARLRHLESVTRGTSIPRDDFLHSYMHYRPLLLEGDPFYNPNLSGWSTLPQLRQVGEESPLSFAERYLEHLGLDIPVLEADGIVQGIDAE